jgi:hypothetical protein
MHRLVRRLAIVVTFAVTGHPATSGEMVLSQFVFRDIDRDGVYDLGEPPIAGVPVRLTQVGTAPAIAETNLAGFANFVMSPGTGQISEPGDIEIEVLPPVDLLPVAGPSRFSTSVRAFAAAPAGLIADETPPFVGLAPRLTLSIGAQESDIVTCIADNGIEVSATGVGQYRHCAVRSGRWSVRWDGDAGTAIRNVVVDGWPLRVPKPVEPHRDTSSTEVLVGFDDLISSNNLIEVPAGVAGMRWRNFVASHRMFYEGAGYVNGTTSGEYSAYNSSGHKAIMWSDTPFDFIAANLTIAWPAGLDGEIRVEALRDGRVVAEDAFQGSRFSPVRFAPDWQGITELRIWHQTYWQVVIDDLVVSR